MHLRQAVADAFDLEFESIGLVEGVYGKEGREGFVAASFEVTGTEPLATGEGLPFPAACRMAVCVRRC